MDLLGIPQCWTATQATSVRDLVFMKIYIAAKFNKKDLVLELQRKLKEQGHEVAYDWTTHKPIKPYEDNQELAQKYSENELLGIGNSDVFVYVSDTEGHTLHMELGAALALSAKIGKPHVIVVGPATYSPWLFNRRVTVVANAEEALKKIDALPARSIDIVSTYIDPMDDQVLLSKCMERGVTMFRQTLGYKTVQIHADRFEKIRGLASKLGKEVSSMWDFPGEKPRLGDFEGTVQLKEGRTVTLTREVGALAKTDRDDVILPLSTSDEIFAKIMEGHRLLLKDGQVQLKVRDKTEKGLECDVISSHAALKFHGGINLPDSDVRYRSIDQKEREGLPLAAKLNPEYIALSFVGFAEDIREARKIVLEHNPKNTSKLIAKIETRQGVENIDEILDEADGVMVARGDLALQTSFEELGVMQEKIVASAMLWGKYALVATQMLDSMVESELPLRAEINDVTQSLRQGSRGVWLSPELALSDNYFLALEMFKKIINQVK